MDGTAARPANPLPMEEAPVTMHCIQSSPDTPPPRGKLAKTLKWFKNFFLRLDVCWTFVFFLLLLCAAVITSTTVRALMLSAISGSWSSLHAVKVVRVTSTYDKISERIYRLATTSMALHASLDYAMENESTLATLCGPLVAYDANYRFFGFSVCSPSLGSVVACMHGDPSLGSEATLSGMVSDRNGIHGTYIVDSQSYEFVQPLVYAANLTMTKPQLLSYLRGVIAHNSFFDIAMDFYNGKIDRVEPKVMWTPDPTVPHLVYFTFPAALVMRGLDINPGENLTNYLRVTLNGAGLAVGGSFVQDGGVQLMVLLNTSLADDDPIVLSTSWGQETVNDTNVFAGALQLPVAYLTCSGITDPLMRAALPHINLKALQAEGNEQQVQFAYRGSYAIVTASSYTTPRGLHVPFVLVSPQADILPPHLYLSHLCSGLIAVAIVLLTALFWSYVHFRFTRPLQRMSALLHQSVTTGQRVTLTQSAHGVLRSAEVEALVVAHNDAMRRLREIDAFVPEVLRESLTKVPEAPATSLAEPPLPGGQTREKGKLSAASNKLMPQKSTIVTVTITQCSNSHPQRQQQQQEEELILHSTSREATVASAAAASSTDLLGRLVASTVRSSGMVNSGPFPSPAALEAFAIAMKELVSAHHGTMHRLAPDGCVVHFGKAVRAHLLSPAAVAAQTALDGAAELSPEERLNVAAVRRESAACVRRDAADAVAFALSLQRWFDHSRRPAMPDVWALLDTSTFTCGLYHNELSEQVMAVAIGRDMHREIGHVPAKIGVRVAMTEETASLVRARVSGWGTRKLEPGVRQLPVEALRTGRVGLNADVVILYEALPGPVAGDAAWQRYSRCCFDAFEFMLCGDYASALSALKRIADISDLEPGLLPRSLSREAASSDVLGGALSSQAERLMKECERHIVARDSTPYYRHRRCPFAIDTVLAGIEYDPLLERLPHFGESAHTPSFSGPHTCSMSADVELPVTSHHVQRCIITTTKRSGGDGDAATQRMVLGGNPEWIRDNSGSVWYVSKTSDAVTWSDPWYGACALLGSAGVLCVMTLIPFSTAPDAVAKAIRDAPDGVMSDALSAAVPTVRPSPKVKSAVERLFIKRQAVSHPNLLTPLAYSLSIEGGVAVIHECCTGGNLRSLYSRYGTFRPLTLVRFCLDILSGLAFLHAHGLAHGMLCFDNVMVAGNGVCRLHHHLLRGATERQVLWSPETCVVSPAMAAGETPTQQCDIFCFGLLCIEASTGQQGWRWADQEEGHNPEKQAELLELTRRGGADFREAVVQRRLVPAVEEMMASEVVAVLTEAERELLLSCFLEDPACRPSASQLLSSNAGVLLRNGFVVEEDKWKKPQI